MVPTLNEARSLSSCFNEVIIPFGYQTVEDSQTPASGQIYEELGYGLVGIAGESRSGDANGPYIRVQAGGGLNTITYPQQETVTGALEDAVGITPAPLIGSIPALSDSAKTPFRPGVPCERQEPPNLDASSFDLAPFANTMSSPIGPRQATPELLSAAEEASDQFEELASLGESLGSARASSTDADDFAAARANYDEALEAVAVELAAVFDMEYLLGDLISDSAVESDDEDTRNVDEEADGEPVAGSETP
jgi:hypothetical protein